MDNPRVKQKKHKMHNPTDIDKLNQTTEFQTTKKVKYEENSVEFGCLLAGYGR